MAGSNTRFLCQKLVYLIQFLRPLFNFISVYIFRLSSFNKSDGRINFLEPEPELLPELKVDSEITDSDNDEKPEVQLKFKFPTYEEFSQIQKETGNVFNFEVVPSSASASKYEFLSAESLIGTFIDDELETFPVKEINDSDNIGNYSGNEENFSDRNLEDENRGKENLVFDGELTKGTEEKEQEMEFVDEYQVFSEKNSVITDSGSDSDSDSESTSFEHLRTVVNRLVDSFDEGFLSDGDFGGVLDEKTESESDLSEDFEEEENDIMEELKKLEEANLQNPEFLCEKDFNEDSSNINKAEKSKLKDLESGDSNKLESLWEHQELIEQLRIELKKVRATGLPTILEESESPKIMEDLKPWKIDEFQRGDCLGELHKFYKSYRERMRKFDIINYQKMYAMGFLRLKDPLQSISQQKPVPPTLRSLVSQNLWLFKHKIHGSDPMKKFIMELQGDLEAVYVGQMCLSWEFLHWQYEKALDLWDSDPRGIRRYNEVAGEFQQFQVLMQRFVEDEPFQGPRVQNYVKTRCAVRNLLQVPVIREDNLKDKRKVRKIERDEYVITSDMLVEIVEESIRIFWSFVRADKDCTIPAINSHKKISNIPSPEDIKLLVEVKKTLQKKERKVKDLLRSENCILRKLRRCRKDDESDQVLYFFSQVDMKLVSRVLNMSRITKDQLTWCHNKLNMIRFVNRKIQVEPSFLLFPC